MRAALAGDHPLDLLGLVSSVLAALEPRRPGPFEPTPAQESITLEELVQSFIDVELPETSALLAVIAELTGDDVMRARIRRALAGRPQVLPRWLQQLADAGVGPAVELVHVLGDGDNVMVGVTLPDGHELSVVVYIDHNLGTVVKDAFAVPEPLATLTELMVSTAEGPDTTWRELDAADARARITDAVRTGAIMFPPLESDTWPACRPLVEWATRLLPEGGTGYQRPTWDSGDRDLLSQRFLDSPFGAALDDDQRDLLDSLLWFGTDYGPGDPLRWSPVAVEILLADWIPRKIVSEVGFLAKAPDLLRAFIRYCHAERGIRPELTATTLAAVDEYEPDYQRVIRTARPQGPAALLAAMGVLDPDLAVEPDLGPSGFPEIMLDTLRRAVGGDQVLDTLDDRPLPDEPFGWDGVPPDVHDRVGEVVALVDRCCNELLDQEYRTACRRFLATAAAGDPEIFRRRGRLDTAAAAVCWVIGKANDLFLPVSGGGMMVKDLTAHFGAPGGVSQRAGVLLRAAGLDEPHHGSVDLGTPRYLTAERRRRILADRDRYRAMQE